MIRHQKENDEDSSSIGNVITILCTDCGFNESVFIQDYLETIFNNWSNLFDSKPRVKEEIRRCFVRSNL